MLNNIVIKHSLPGETAKNSKIIDMLHILHGEKASIISNQLNHFVCCFTGRETKTFEQSREAAEHRTNRARTSNENTITALLTF